MHSKVKNYALVFCLFVFLFVTIGGGLHMNPGGAFLAAATGTPLMIYAFNRKSKGDCRPEHVPPHLREMRFDMAATNRITPIDESEVAVNESAGSERSEPTRAVRRHLPDERRALTHHFSIAGQEGYLTVGVYEDGLPGEIFITMAKQGSTISGLMDAFATVVSLALQHGVPLSVLCEKLSHMRFEPSGWSGNPKIGYAKSLMDYIARWLELRFLTGDQGELFKALPMPIQPAIEANSTDPVGALGELIQMGDAPACNICGSLMVRSGTCYRCMTCGSTSGCS